MQYQEYAGEIKQTLDRMPWDKLQAVVDLVRSAWIANRQVFVMGNGGSAATASHMACDLSKNTAVPGMPRLRVLSLNENMAHFSAHANDDGYDSVFAEQLRNFVGEGDVVIAISTSGNSSNVLKAIDVARAAGAVTVGWTGYQGGKLVAMVDLPIVVPSDTIEHIEDIHLIMEHMVTVALRQIVKDEAQMRSGSQPQPQIPTGAGKP